MTSSTNPSYMVAGYYPGSDPNQQIANSQQPAYSVAQNTSAISVTQPNQIQNPPSAPSSQILQGQAYVPVPSNQYPSATQFPDNGQYITSNPSVHPNNGSNQYILGNTQNAPASNIAPSVPYSVDNNYYSSNNSQAVPQSTAVNNQYSTLVNQVNTGNYFQPPVDSSNYPTIVYPTGYNQQYEGNTQLNPENVPINQQPTQNYQYYVPQNNTGGNNPYIAGNGQYILVGDPSYADNRNFLTGNLQQYQQYTSENPRYLLHKPDKQRNQTENINDNTSRNPSKNSKYDSNFFQNGHNTTDYTQHHSENIRYINGLGEYSSQHLPKSLTYSKPTLKTKPVDLDNSRYTRNNHLLSSGLGNFDKADGHKKDSVKVPIDHKKDSRPINSLQIPKLDLKLSKDSKDYTIQSGSDEDYRGFYPNSPVKQKPTGLVNVILPRKQKRLHKRMKSHSKHKSGSKSSKKRHAKEVRRGSEADSETEMSTGASEVSVMNKPPRKLYRSYKDYYDPETKDSGKDPRLFRREKRQTRANILSRAELLLDKRKHYNHFQSETEFSTLSEVETGYPKRVARASPVAFYDSGVDIYQSAKQRIKSKSVPIIPHGNYQKQASQTSFYSVKSNQKPPKNTSNHLVRQNSVHARALKTKVFNYGDMTYTYKNAMTDTPKAPTSTVGMLTMNALWNLRKEEKGELSDASFDTRSPYIMPVGGVDNDAYFDDHGKNHYSLTKKWNDNHPHHNIDTDRSSDILDVKENKPKNKGLKSFRTMQKQRSQQNGPQKMVAGYYPGSDPNQQIANSQQPAYSVAQNTSAISVTQPNQIQNPPSAPSSQILQGQAYVPVPSNQYPSATQFPDNGQYITSNPSVHPNNGSNQYILGNTQNAPASNIAPSVPYSVDNNYYSSNNSQAVPQSTAVNNQYSTLVNQVNTGNYFQPPVDSSNYPTIVYPTGYNQQYEGNTQLNPENVPINQQPTQNYQYYVPQNNTGGNNPYIAGNGQYILVGDPSYADNRNFLTGNLQQYQQYTSENPRYLLHKPDKQRNQTENINDNTSRNPSKNSKYDSNFFQNGHNTTDYTQHHSENIRYINGLGEYSSQHLPKSLTYSKPTLKTKPVDLDNSRYTRNNHLLSSGLGNFDKADRHKKDSVKVPIDHKKDSRPINSLQIPKLDLKLSKDSKDYTIQSGSDEDYRGFYPNSPVKQKPTGLVNVILPRKQKRLHKRMKSHSKHKSGSKSSKKRHAKEVRRGSEADSETEMSTGASEVSVMNKPPRKLYRSYKDYYDPETKDSGKDPRLFRREKRQTRANILSRAELLLDKRKHYNHFQSETEFSTLSEVETGYPKRVARASPVAFYDSGVDIYQSAKQRIKSKSVPIIPHGNYQKQASQTSFYSVKSNQKPPKNTSNHLVRQNSVHARALKTKVFNYGDMTYTYKNAMTDTPKAPTSTVGMLTMNALWNLRKEEKGELSDASFDTRSPYIMPVGGVDNDAYFDDHGKNHYSLTKKWNDNHPHHNIDTDRSSDILDVKENKPKNKGLKSFRTMQKQRSQQNGPQKNASSVGLSDDDDGLESEVIYSSTDVPMNRGPRYEESLHDDGSGKGNEKSLKKPKRVIFFVNKVPDFKGKEVLISQRNFANFEALLIELCDTLPVNKGVKFIFNYPSGKEIRSLLEFEQGQSYLASSDKKVDTTQNYGKSREGYWQNSRPVHDERHLFKGRNTQIETGATHSASRKQPLNITIISNLVRESKHILLLNPQSEGIFEDILEDIPQMVTIPEKPVLSLWTVKKPMEKVESFSALASLYKNGIKEFYAVGKEGVPMEMDTTNRTRNANGSQQDGLMSTSLSMNGLNRKGGSFKDKRSVETTRVIINKQPREFFLPTEIDEDGRKPNKKLILDWVYGFRGRDVEDNIKVLITGELVYYVATVVVIFEKREQRYQDKSKPLTTELQRHYTGHNEEVTCLALHPNKRFIASGQLAGSSPEFAAHVRIWDGLTLTTYQVVGFDVFKASVKTVAFSVETEGDYIMVIDDSEKHELSVWDWEKPKRIAKTTTTADAVAGGCFYPGDRNDKKYNNDIIITYGNKHLHFWKLFWESSSDRGVTCKILRDKKSGVFEEDTPNVMSLAFTEEGQVITGNSDGTIHIWVDTKDDYVFILSEELPAHKKGVSSLCMKPDGVLVSGGGNEIKHWDSQAGYKKLKEKTLPELAGNVRSVVLQNIDAPDALYIGTTKSCVLEYVAKKFSYVIQGNSDEIWAIASHPKEGSFITAGHDQLVIKWSTLNHGIKWKTQIEKPCVSVAIDPKGALVAVGTTVGKLVLLKAEDGSEITSTQVGNAQINALSFSQDGKKLAIGAHDGFTHVFNINEHFQFTRTQSAALKNNNSFVSQVDWSVDSNFLQTVLGDYEVVYWDINNMQKKKDARIMRDVEWYTQTCSVGYGLIGPWSNLENGEVINVAGRSAKSEFMAVGDNRGRIRLYRYPATSLQAQFRNVKAYSNNVTAITFTADDSFVLTSGGNDAALFQWVVSDLNAA